MAFLRAVDRFIHAIDAANEWAGKAMGFFLLALVVVMVSRVVARYVFDHPFVWGYEVTLYIYATLLMLTGGYTLKHNAHVNVNIVERHLSVRKAAILRLFTAPVLFFFVGLLIWQGARMAHTSVIIAERYPSLWAPIIYPLKILIPVGASLLFVQGIARLSRDVRVVFQDRSGAKES